MEENKEEVKTEAPKNIIERHYSEGKYNLTTAFLEVDKRISMLEEAMGYLAEIERRKQGLGDKIDSLILPEEPKIIKPNEF